MGYGRRYYCEKCFYDFEEYGGIGYTYPMVVNGVKDEGKEGKLGPEVKAFLDLYPDGVLNCEMVGLVCKECGAMKNDCKYSMYKPKEGIKKFPVCCLPHELSQYYSFYKRYPHKCNECGGDMKMLSQKETPKCPVCNIPLKQALFGTMCWD